MAGGYDKRTQCMQILHHLRNFGSITRIVSFNRYSICNLPQRIAEIEADGHLINRAPIKRNGKRYVAYSLVEAARRAA